MVASVRAGNVIGGGDWADNRIVPDIVGCLMNDRPLVLRNPNSIRPWQHVLDPLNGYLTLAANMLRGKDRVEGAWNFGPDSKDTPTVREVAEMMMASWGKTVPIEVVPNENFHESKMLRLDCTKAKASLDWSPRIDIKKAIDHTVGWYQAWSKGQDMFQITDQQIGDLWGLSQ